MNVQSNCTLVDQMLSLGLINKIQKFSEMVPVPQAILIEICISFSYIAAGSTS